MNTAIPSTSAAHGFKDYEYPLVRTPYAFRIFVLGDSLAFGQGIRMDETFAKVLEDTLNRNGSSRVFEVINSAVPGLNAVQEYCLQKTLGAHYRPDIYLLALCYNDAELYQLQDVSRHEEHIRRIWDRQGDTFPYFREALTRSRDMAAAQGSRLIVAYFVFGAVSIAPHAPEVLRETCQDLGILFTDVGETTRYYPSHSLWVNEVENHPNAMFHRLAAQHIAQFLQENQILPPDDPSTDERAVVRSIVESFFGEDRLLHSESLSYPLTRTTSLLQTKLQRKSWQDTPPHMLSRPEIENALAILSPLLRRSQIIECLDAYDTFLRSAIVQDQLNLLGMRKLLMDMELSIFYFSMTNARRALLPEMITHADAQPPEPKLDAVPKAIEILSHRVNQLQTFQQNLLRTYRVSLDAMASGHADSFLGPALAAVARTLGSSLTGSQRPFGVILAEADRAGRALLEAGQELERELETYRRMKPEDFCDGDQFRRYRHFAWETVDFYLAIVERYHLSLREINLDGLTQILTRLADGSVASCPGRTLDLEIVVQAPPSPDYSYLGAYWTNVVPFAAPRRDTLAIQKDNLEHAYRFRFPIGSLGYFTLELENLDISHIRTIRAYFNGKRIREWPAERIQHLKENDFRSELLITNESE